MTLSVEEMVMHHLEHLCVEIGPRPSGSEGNQSAAGYIRDVFAAAGLEVELQAYACPAWEDRDTLLELDGEKLEAVANAFSPPCDVTAPCVAVGTLAELEAATLEGRIGILYGDLTKAPLSPKSWFLKSERDERIVQLLEEKQPAALITVQSGAGLLERLIEDAEFLVPSATVTPHAGLKLVQAGQPAHLRIASQQSPGRACNVVARKAGSSPTKVVLCAHYDTKFDTPGAHDNASGVAVLLALAEQLSQHHQTLSLEWVAFSGEEYLPLGDDEYLRRGEGQFPQIIAAINVDAVGQHLGPNSITMLASSQPFQEAVTELIASYPSMVWVDPWPESNHSTFSWRGVPSLAFTSAGAPHLAHLRNDTIDWISPARLGEVVTLIAEIVTSLQDKSPAWTREAGSTDDEAA